ncbi:hypothetical protein FOL47_003308 [Perkinsus chesapeaki]|uniref:NAD(P)-binding domain-containing protein n=1 Tax=Perkinsus chesapeaki TaxID=330153 RepID=A0A7J6N118_PERCH|nr:hypothetical protein FOL47_003308 [Perkinsus chesapeaki]
MIRMNASLDTVIWLPISGSTADLDALRARIRDLENGPARTALEGVTGKLFTEDIKREYNGRRSDEEVVDGETNCTKDPCCTKWIAITTIADATPDGVKVAADVMLSTGEWCMVIAGDKKGPREMWADLKQHPMGSMIVFLSDDEQVAVGGEFAEKLPWKHFGRKNVAYLYALVHGAEKILDLDDDNIVYPDSIDDITNGTFTSRCCPENHAYTVSPTAARPSVFNPYSTGMANLEGEVLWPRGFPLRYIKRPHATSITRRIPLTGGVAVVQTLADHDPDFDAIYRLTRPLPADFHQLAAPAFILQSTVFTPLNAQACLFKDYDALWGLYLPVTVHGRVSDIWRGFRLLWDIGASVAVAGRTWVKQIRNSHDYLGDFIAEENVYEKSEVMMRFLTTWQPTASSTPFMSFPMRMTDTLPGRLEEAYIELFSRGFVEEDEVYHVQRWINAFTSAGYRWPSIVAFHHGKDATNETGAAQAQPSGPPPAHFCDGTTRRTVRVWITGINGMIGSSLAKALIGLTKDPNGPCYAVFGMVRYRANLGNLAGVMDNVTLTYGDLTDAQRVGQIVREVRPHLVFHFAAQGINGVSFQSESLTYKSNVEGTSNVLQALRRTGARVLVASSSTVYGSTSDSPEYIGKPIPESAPMGPVSPYGVSKAATEMICLQQHKAHGTHCVAVRLFIHVSPGGTEALALQEFCRQVAMIEGGKQEPVIKHGSLSTRRDTTDIRDSAIQLIKLLEASDPGEVYNVGSYLPETSDEREPGPPRHTGVVSTEELLHLVLSESPIGGRIELRQDASRMRAYDEAVLIANNTKLRNLTGWVPANDIRQTVRDVLEYWRGEVSRRYPDAKTDHWESSVDPDDLHGKAVWMFKDKPHTMADRRIRPSTLKNRSTQKNWPYHKTKYFSKTFYQTDFNNPTLDKSNTKIHIVYEPFVETDVYFTLRNALQRAYPGIGVTGEGFSTSSDKGWFKIYRMNDKRVLFCAQPQSMTPDKAKEMGRTYDRDSPVIAGLQPDARAALSAFSGFSKNVTVPADPTMRIDTPDTADDIQFPSLMTEAVRVVDRCIEDDTEPPTLAELRQQRARRVEHLASERLKRKHGGGEGVQPFRHDYTVRGTVRKTTLIKRIKSALPSEYSSIVKNAEEDLSVEEGLHRMPDKSEVIISVDVYTTDQRSFRRNDHYESIDILGSQTLKELRDSFCFTCDELYDGPFYARSACFVIGHWVYTDLPDNPGRREKVVNYEEHIRNWLRVHDDSIEPEARQSLPEIHFAEMQSTTVSQAVERLYRLSPNGHSQCCFYLHYTDQEERIYFTNVTLLDSRVHSLIRQVYPLKTFRRQKLNLTLCAVIMQCSLR